jgi:hypothetical protein
MTLYTPVLKKASYETESDILEFLINLPQTETVQSMIIQFNYIMKQETGNNYYLFFNSDDLNLCSTTPVQPNFANGVRLSLFFNEIKKALNLSNTNKTKENTMKQITLENLKDITNNYTIFIYQDKSSNDPVKSLRMLSGYWNSATQSGFEYSFMTLSNPLIVGEFRGNTIYESIHSALENGMDVYAAESIGRITFNLPKKESNKDLNQPKLFNEHNFKLLSGAPYIPKNKPTEIGVIEEYIFSILRKHSEYLRTELSLTQYPKETYLEVTEKFITEILK